MLNCLKLHVKRKHVLPRTKTFPKQTRIYTNYILDNLPKNCDLLIDINPFNKYIKLAIPAEGPDKDISIIKNSRNNKSLLLSVTDEQTKEFEIPADALIYLLEILTANVETITAWQNIFKRNKNKEARLPAWIFIDK